VILSDINICSDTKRRAVSLRQLSFLFAWKVSYTNTLTHKKPQNVAKLSLYKGAHRAIELFLVS